MPVLHKSPSDSHYYVRASHLGRRMTLQLTPEGVRYLTESLGLKEGDDLDADEVEFLFEKRWAYTHGGGLGEEVDGLGDRSEMSGVSPVSQAGPPGVDGRTLVSRRIKAAISIRMESHDHAILDRSVKDIIEAARLVGAILHGPTPLPTRVEKYTVVGSRSRRSIEMRTHKRRIDIENVSGETLAVLNRLNLPAGVCISIRPIASAQR